MNKVEQSIRSNLKAARIMQLASSANNQSWICTVHFVADKDLNIYWFSKTDRRHSKEIAKNSKVSVYFLVHEDKPDEKYVIGITAEGTARLVDANDEVSNVKAYINKLDLSQNFLDNVLSGKEPHKLYKFVPSSFVLFDNKNFPEQARQEFSL